MRRLAWMLLLLFVFTIPWEYSLDFGAPWGNIARILGLLIAALMIPATLQAGRIRPLRVFHVTVSLWVLWLCCSVFWSVVARTTAAHLPGYFEEVIIVWLVWELIESDADLMAVMSAYVAGAAVLAMLTFADFAHPQLPDQVRFVPQGQDPNDVARYLVFALPFAAWLVDAVKSRWQRALLLVALPMGTIAILLTASRGGFLACTLSLVACGLLLWRRHARLVVGTLFLAPVAAAALWIVVPHETLLRLGSIPAQLAGGDLNQRWEIWEAGWRAFARAPLMGWGEGSFVWTAKLAPIDTAHDTALAIAAEGGLISLGLACTIVVLCLRSLRYARNSLRLALGIALGAWAFLSLVSNVQENRTTWLLLGLVVAAGRLGKSETADGTLRSGAEVVLSSPTADEAAGNGGEAAGWIGQPGDVKAHPMDERPISLPHEPAEDCGG